MGIKGVRLYDHKQLMNVAYCLRLKIKCIYQLNFPSKDSTMVYTSPDDSRIPGLRTGHAPRCAGVLHNSLLSRLATLDFVETRLSFSLISRESLVSHKYHQSGGIAGIASRCRPSPPVPSSMRTSISEVNYSKRTKSSGLLYLTSSKMLSNKSPLRAMMSH